MSSADRRTVDIRAFVCPMTWVRVKLARRNVPRSARGEGHEVLVEHELSDHHLLRLRRGGP